MRWFLAYGFGVFLFLIYFLLGSRRWYLPFINRCYPDTKQDCGFEDGSPVAESTNIRFFLFTRRNPSEPEQLHMCKDRLPKKSNYNPDKRLLVFLPPFIAGICQISIIDDIKDAWLKRDDYNVIIVEDVYHYGFDYYQATKNSLNIANRTAQLLQNIQDDVGLKTESIDLVGLSLGAQTAGQVGRLFKVHRITGLDPSGVLYSENYAEDQRLSRNDAEIVDIIHTNTRTGFFDFGISYTAGHADFYPNGGEKQPDCWSNVKMALKRSDLSMVTTLMIPTLCYHVQSLYYYYVSILGEYGNFTAWSCDSYEDYQNGKCNGKGAESVVMGFNFEDTFTPEQRKKSLPRKYYLDTLNTWPFVKEDGVPNKV